MKQNSSLREVPQFVSGVLTGNTLLVLELSDYRIFAAQHPELAQAVEAEGARRLSEVRASRAAASNAVQTPVTEGAGTDP